MGIQSLHQCHNCQFCVFVKNPIVFTICTITQPIEFFTISQQYNNAVIANFILTVPLDIEKANGICNVQT